MKGIQITIVASMEPGMTTSSQSFIAGNMPPERLMTLVGAMPSDKTRDVSPLALPSMKMSFVHGSRGSKESV